MVFIRWLDANNPGDHIYQHPSISLMVASRRVQVDQTPPYQILPRENAPDWLSTFPNTCGIRTPVYKAIKPPMDAPATPNSPGNVSISIRFNSFVANGNTLSHQISKGGFTTCIFDRFWISVLHYSRTRSRWVESFSEISNCPQYNLIAHDEGIPDHPTPRAEVLAQSLGGW